MYDLTVDNIHTYYVVAGSTPVLVHNRNCTGVALGYRLEGTKEFALNKGLGHFLDYGADEWRGPAMDAIADRNVPLHVNTKGFGGDFRTMALRGLKRDPDFPNPQATEEEMGWIARAVANGQRTWSSVKFYNADGEVINVPEPDWSTFGRLAPLPT